MDIVETDNKIKISISIEKKVYDSIKFICKKDKKNLSVSKLINHILKRGIRELSYQNMLCEICKTYDFRIHLHHIDGDHENNTLDNRIYLCEFCHSLIHNTNEKSIEHCPSKFADLIIYYKKLLKEKGEEKVIHHKDWL